MEVRQSAVMFGVEVVTLILTLVFAPLSIALIILYLQQLEKTHTMKKDNEALQAEVSKLREQLVEQSAKHGQQAGNIVRKCDDDIKRKEEEISDLRGKLQGYERFVGPADLARMRERVGEQEDSRGMSR